MFLIKLSHFIPKSILEPLFVLIDTSNGISRCAVGIILAIYFGPEQKKNNAS